MSPIAGQTAGQIELKCFVHTHGQPVGALKYLYLRNAEMDQKYEETDQQIEIFKVFEKIENGSKI